MTCAFSGCIDPAYLREGRAAKIESRKMAFNEQEQILLLQPLALEELVKKWIARLDREYLGFDRPSRSADMGRDAVGFVTAQRYDGEWHNYQCKQLSKPLGIAAFALELGKIFHYACAGHFSLPTKYIFVAPKGGVGDVNELIGKPSTIGPYLIEHWDEYCLTRISSPKHPTPLTDEIRKAIEDYDFSKVDLWNANHLVELRQMRAVLIEHIDIDPGAAPTVSEEEVPETPKNTSWGMSGNSSPCLESIAALRSPIQPKSPLMMTMAPS